MSRPAESSGPPGKARELALALGLGALTVVCFQALFGGFFPSANGRIGHDYGYFFPQLLTGVYWFEENGPFAVPWFTPALGGGVPYYPNPASTYYSLPQLLSLFQDPLAAVRTTLVVFAALGFLGTWVLLRGALGCGVWSACFGAVLFTFNGFYSTRMLVGHMAFHSIMLLPWIAWLTLRPLPASGSGRWRRLLFDGLAAGVLYAYMFQSAYFYGIPVVVLAILCLALIASLWRPGELGGWSCLPRTALAGAVALALSCSKLGASSSFLASFPRSGYPLPGFDGIGTGLTTLARALFWRAPIETDGLVTNTTYSLAGHEFELGVTPVAALALAVGLGALVIGAGGVAGRARTGAMLRSAKLALLALLLAVPFAINVHQEDWTAFLKTLPLLESSSNLLRNLVAYVPVAVALAAVGIEALPGRVRPFAALSGAALAVVFVARDDRTAYANEIYDPATVVAAWEDLKLEGGYVPPIRAITAPFDAEGRPHTPIDRNDALVRGESQLICYEPIFGYQLEFFPKFGLRLGPIDQRGPEGLNMYDPALFVFPELNGGQPGDRFQPDELPKMKAFASYRPFEFERGARQRWLDRANLAAVAVAALALAAYPLWRPQRAQYTPVPE